MSKVHFVLDLTNGRAQCGKFKLGSRTWKATTELDKVTCGTCLKTPAYKRIAEWHAAQQRAEQVPMFCVVAYIGDCEPADQPYWGALYHRLSDARDKADETWDWLVGQIKRDQHPLNDDIDKAAVVVWKVDSYEIKNGVPIDVVWGEDNENIKYVRGHLDDEVDSE